VSGEAETPAEGFAAVPDPAIEPVAEPVEALAAPAAAASWSTPEPIPSAPGWETDPGAGLGAGDGQAGSDRPEILAGAAFAGGLLTALILKRLGRD
jgi:hypothetical protein